MKRLLLLVVLLAVLVFVPASAQAVDPVAQIITSVNMTQASGAVNADVVFARTYGARIYRVYYNTTNDSDLSTWQYAQFSGTPLANKVAVTGLATNTTYYFKVRVSSAMGTLIVDSDVWSLDTTSGSASVYSKSYVPIDSTVTSPLTLDVPFTSDAGTSTVQVTVPAAVAQTLSSISVESHNVSGNTALTFTLKDTSGADVTSVSEPLIFVLPYDSGISESNLTLGYTHDGTDYTVKKVPDQGNSDSLIASDGFYWSANNESSFIFVTKKFSTLTQAPANAGTGSGSGTSVPASSTTTIALLVIAAMSLGGFAVAKQHQ